MSATYIQVTKTLTITTKPEN